MSEESASQDQSIPAAEPLAEASAFYDAEGLAIPPVPRTLADLLKQRSLGTWGTSNVDLADREGFFDRAIDPDLPDSVDFGHIGYGMASWWLSYQLVFGGLAVFLRQPYGGLYQDVDAARVAVEAALHELETLLVAAWRATEEGHLTRDTRLIVALDSRGNSGWGLTDDAGEWHESEDPLGDARSFLEV